MHPQQRIIEVLRKHPEGLTLDQLTEKLQISKEEVAFHVGYLRGREKKVFMIQWAATNDSGKTCNLYKLNETEPS
jgi:predicted ArsR family transcriptional regulator